MHYLTDYIYCYEYVKLQVQTAEFIFIEKSHVNEAT